VTAKVPAAMSATFHGRKHYTSQNILAPADFDLRFTYVLTVWECSTHDAIIMSYFFVKVDCKSPMVSSSLEMLDMHADLVFYL
jgi:hypothetical protein